MFKQVFRVTFIAYVWKQYKQAIVSTLLLFAYLWLVSSVHADFLSYAESQQDDALVGRSFLYKWAAFIGGAVVFLLYHWLRGFARRDTASEHKAGQSWFASKPEKSAELQEGPDPFEEIRRKDKLRTRAEIMIDRNKDTN